MPDSQEEQAKQENEETPSPISALATMIEKLSFQVHSLHEDVSGIADRMDVIDNKHRDEQQVVSSQSSSTETRRPSAVFPPTPLNEAIQEIPEPSQEARRSFLALITKPLGTTLTSPSVFTQWTFALKISLALVGLQDHVLKSHAAPDWLNKFPELTTGSLPTHCAFAE